MAIASPQEPPFVLVADDDAARLASLRTALRLAGAEVAACKTTKVALEALRFHLPNVVVVAPEMEKGEGWSLLYAAKKQSGTPTLVLDRARDEATRRAAFAAGADDVAAARSDDAELATRVIALSRRSRRGDESTPVYRHRGIVMDVAAHTLRVDARNVSLTAQQFAILRALLEANGATLSRERLLARIESLDDEPPSDRAIDLHVTRLRRRLGDDARRPRWIEAVYGVGYRLVTTEPTRADLTGDAEHVLAALPDPLLVIDGDRRVRFANDAASRFLALPQAAIVGHSCAELLQCRDCDGVSLSGTRCFARAVEHADTALRDVPAVIAVGDEHVNVEFTYARVHSDGLMTIEIRPRHEVTEPA